MNTSDGSGRTRGGARKAQRARWWRRRNAREPRTPRPQTSPQTTESTAERVRTVRLVKPRGQLSAAPCTPVPLLAPLVIPFVAVALIAGAGIAQAGVGLFHIQTMRCTVTDVGRAETGTTIYVDSLDCPRLSVSEDMAATIKPGRRYWLQTRGYGAPTVFHAEISPV